jgi:hypothetical protein
MGGTRCSSVALRGMRPLVAVALLLVGAAAAAAAAVLHNELPDAPPAGALMHHMHDHAAEFGLALSPDAITAATPHGGRSLQSNAAPTWTTPLTATIRVPDVAALGYVITSLVAWDTDPSFSASGKLSYSLQDVSPAGGAGLFVVDAATGRLQVAASLAGTWRAAPLGATAYNVTVRATDGLGAFASPDTLVTVVVWPG